MGKCVCCGKKGLFLSVNADGLCKICAENDRISKQREAECERIAKQQEILAKQKELEAELLEKKKKNALPNYRDFGGVRYYKTRIYNCGIDDYNGKKIDKYDYVTFSDNSSSDPYDIYADRMKVLHDYQKIGFVDRSGISNMISENFVSACIVDTDPTFPSFDVAVYSKITSLPSLKVMPLKSSETCIDNYLAHEKEICKYSPISIKGDEIYWNEVCLGVLPDKEMAKLVEIPEHREQYPVFYSKREDKKGNTVLSIKIYYSLADDELFRDTSKFEPVGIRL